MKQYLSNAETLMNMSKYLQKWQRYTTLKNTYFTDVIEALNLESYNFLEKYESKYPSMPNLYFSS